MRKTILIITCFICAVFVGYFIKIPTKDKNTIIALTESVTAHTTIKPNAQQVPIVKLQQTTIQSTQPKITTTQTPKITVQTPTSTPTSVPTPIPTVTPTPIIEEKAPLLDGITIGIDAGHQQKGNNQQESVAPNSSETKAKVSSGTQGINTKIPEYKLNLEVALLLEELLKESGATVIMVRETNDVDISNAQRATMMNDVNVDLCIRIHANGSENKSTNGAMMLIPSSNYTKNIEDASRTAGEIILKHFIEQTGAKNIGLIKRADLTGFNWSTVPVCLIEMGYMSNPEEDRLLSTPDYQAKCAKGLYDGIVEQFANVIN